MSKSSETTITCDSCGKKRVEKDTHCPAEWMHIAIDCYVYKDHPPQWQRHMSDYCPDCVDKKGRNTLLIEAATKAQR